MRKRALFAATGFLVAILINAVNAQDTPGWEPDPEHAGAVSVGYQGLHRMIANASVGRGWTQWGQDAQHTGTVNVAGQSLNRILADIVYDPFAPQQQAEWGGSADLAPEWKWQNTNTETCTRNADGSLSCVADQPGGFEFCINAPAVDRHGVVYANSEDGFLYAINPNGTLKQKIFLNSAIGAAYTPLSIGSDGKIYTQNAGHLFAIGAK